MKRILLTLSQKWPEYLLEIFVLIIGIYGAFALESWKEENKDNDNRIVLLKALSEEFKTNLSQIDSVEKYDRVVIDACITARNLVGKEININQDSLNLLISSLWYNWTFNPINGSLRSGISSGEIHLIKNETLRNLLFSWTDLVMDLSEEVEITSQHHFKSQDFFKKYVRIGDLLGGSKKSKFQSNTPALFQDPLFEDYLNMRQTNKMTVKAELDIIKNQNKRILELISKEQATK